MKPTNQSLTGSSTLATALNQPRVKHFICREFEFGLVLDSGPIHFDFIWASPLSSCWQAYHMFAETPSGVPVYDVRRLIDLGMLPHAPVLSMKRSIGILSNTKRSFRSAPLPDSSFGDHEATRRRYRWWWLRWEDPWDEGALLRLPIDRPIWGRSSDGTRAGWDLYVLLRSPFFLVECGEI